MCCDVVWCGVVWCGLCAASAVVSQLLPPSVGVTGPCLPSALYIVTQGSMPPSVSVYIPVPSYYAHPHADVPWLVLLLLVTHPCIIV